MEVVMTRLATLVSLAAMCLTSAAAHAQTPAPPPAVQSDFALPSLDTKWTGDLDGMIKRRIIRILAPYSKTFYFVDRGVQRGLIYEISEIFERDLNKRLKTGTSRYMSRSFPPPAANSLPRSGTAGATSRWETR
jgi:hypothetical protein